jgi:hypothetical protein
MTKKKIRVSEIRITWNSEEPHEEKDEIREAKKIAKKVEHPVYFFHDVYAIRVFPSGRIQKWRRIDMPEPMCKPSKQLYFEGVDE